MSKFGIKDSPEVLVADYPMPEFDKPAASRTKASPNYIFTSFGDNSEEVAMTLAEAEAQAKVIIEEAKAEAQRIVQETKAIKAEAEAIRAAAKEEGYRTGYNEGLPQGREDGLRNFETAAAPAIEAFQKVDHLYDNIWTVNEPLMMKLALTVAERIVWYEIATSPETIAGAFRAAIDHLKEQYRAVFRVHPEDLSLLEEVRGELRDKVGGLVKITFEPDPNLGRGDLIMETEAGKVDATIRRRIENVMTVMEDALEENYDLDW